MIKNIARIAAVKTIMVLAATLPLSSYASSSATYVSGSSPETEMGICGTVTLSESTHSHETQVEIKTVPGGVDIISATDNPLKVTVYTLTGKIIRSFETRYGSNFVELAPGYYIIRIGRLSHKVIVK